MNISNIIPSINTIDLKNNFFYDKINIKKFDYLMKHLNDYNFIIEPQEKLQRRYENYDFRTILYKISDIIIIPPHLHNTDYGYIPTSFVYGKKSNDKGRLYTKGGLGLQQLIGSIRGLICDNIYYDIDIKNAHPSFLEQLFNSFDIISPLLSEYNKNREDFLQLIAKDENITRDIAKSIIIATINGNNKMKSKRLKAFSIEIKENLNKLIYEKNNIPIFNEIRDDVINNYITNREGKIISRILQIIEKNCLDCMIEYFNSLNLIPKINDRYIITPIFDGLQILKQDIINIDNILNDCENYVKIRCGVEIELSIKKFDNSIILPENYRDTFNGFRYKHIENEPFINKTINDNKKIEHDINLIESPNDDEGACSLIVNKFKDKLLICKNQLYIYDNMKYIWINNVKEVDKILSNMIKNLDIKYYGNDNKKIYSYSSSQKHQQNAIKCIKNSMDIKIDNNFLRDLMINNKYYLPFLNGVWDFRKRNIINYNELPLNVNFLSIIQRNLNPFNNDDYNLLFDKVLIPIYPNNDERLFNAHLRARAIAGNVEDKYWVFQLGQRNSGKGVETELLLNAFGEYVKPFDTSCLLYNKNKSHDAKNLSWLYDKMFCRLLIGNEGESDDNIKKTEDIKINSKLFKSLASGGDFIEVRQNYQNEESFRVPFIIFISANHDINATTKDIYENMLQINYDSKFVSAYEKETKYTNLKNYKIKDDTIKSFVRDDNIINAYIWYILNQYDDILREPPESIKAIKDETDDKQQISIDEWCIKHFIETDDYNDRIHISVINDLIIDIGEYNHKFNITPIFKRLLLGEYNKNITIDGIKKAGFYKIKYIP